MDIETYMEEVRRALPDVPKATMDAALAALQDHVHDEVGRLVKSGKSHHEASADAVIGLGQPRGLEITVSENEVVINSSLRRHEIARGPLTDYRGRPVRPLKSKKSRGPAVLLATLLVFGGGVILALFMFGSLGDSFRNDVQESLPVNLYGRQNSWGTSNPNLGLESGTFEFPEEMDNFLLEFDVTSSSGCVRIMLTHPDGASEDIGSSSCETGHFAKKYTAPGNYRVEYQFVAFAGSVGVTATGYPV